MTTNPFHKICAVCGSVLIWPDPDRDGFHLESELNTVGDTCTQCMDTHCKSVECGGCKKFTFDNCPFAIVKELKLAVPQETLESR